VTLLHPELVITADRLFELPTATCPNCKVDGENVKWVAALAGVCTKKAAKNASDAK